MKNSYDTAVRIAERRLDKVRAAIGKAVDELGQIERAQDEAEAALTRECLLAAGDHRLSTEFFFIRARDQRVRLMADREMAHARLEQLRQEAVACYGERQAVETAAQRHRDEAERSAAAAEQAAIDDLSAARRPRRRVPRTRALA